MNQFRKDLNKVDEADIESIKSDLTECLESEIELNVSDLVNFFNRSSVSEPNTPTKVTKFYLPVRRNSISDLSKTFKFKMSLEDDLKAVKATRSATKAWITRSTNSIKKIA